MLLMFDATQGRLTGTRKHHLPATRSHGAGTTSFSPEARTTWGRTGIPGPQIMADRIKGHIEVTFQGACLLRERAKWKRSEHF